MRGHQAVDVDVVWPSMRIARAKRMIESAVEIVWARGFFAMWRPFTPAPVCAGVGNGPRVLVVAPHPDDETLGCGGSIVLHRRAGHAVTVVIMTDGGRSTVTTPAARRLESMAAAEVLGGTWRRFELPEGDWALDQATDRLVAVLSDVRPDLVYGPSCVDYHPEHVKVAVALGQALTAVSPQSRVRVFEIGVPLTPILANCRVDVEPVQAITQKALAAYRSQRGTIDAIRRLRRYTRRLYGTRGETEVFWETSASTYGRLMSGEPLPNARQFYGVRPRPFSDPLCYLVGLLARYRMRRLAEQDGPA